MNIVRSHKVDWSLRFLRWLIYIHRIEEPCELSPRRHSNTGMDDTDVGIMFPSFLSLALQHSQEHRTQEHNARSICMIFTPREKPRAVPYCQSRRQKGPISVQTAFSFSEAVLSFVLESESESESETKQTWAFSKYWFIGLLFDRFFVAGQFLFQFPNMSLQGPSNDRLFLDIHIYIYIKGFQFSLPTLSSVSQRHKR